MGGLKTKLRNSLQSIVAFKSSVFGPPAAAINNNDWDFCRPSFESKHKKPSKGTFPLLFVRSSHRQKTSSTPFLRLLVDSLAAAGALSTAVETFLVFAVFSAAVVLGAKKGSSKRAWAVNRFSGSLSSSPS